MQLCQHLHENALPLRQVEQAFREFADNLNDDSVTTLVSIINEFANKLSRKQVKCFTFRTNF